MDEENLTIWDKAWYRARTPFGGFFSNSLSQVFATVTIATSLIDGITSFFTFLYTAFPPVIDRVSTAFSTVHDFISGLFTTAGDTVVQQAETVVTDIQSGEIIGDGGASIWDIAKYLFNVDVLSEFLNFVVSVGWLWLFLVVSILVICTALLLSGCVIYVTRRFIVFVSVGLVDYG